MDAVENGPEIASQWQALKDNDNTRQRLFEQLLKIYNKTKEDNHELKNKIQTLEYQSSSPFVMVLIDGDTTLFHDDYVKQGAEGGRQAASDLNSKLREHLREHTSYESHWSTIVRIYIKAKWLIKTYIDSGVIDNENIVRDFFRGFNEVYPLFEYVDAGHDKEGADRKVKANITLFVNNKHCKHIVLAGSADQGYVGFLREFGLDHNAAKRITLLESVPFPAAARESVRRFQVTEFPEIFRSAKIDVQRQLAEPDPLSYARTTATVSSRATAGPTSPTLSLRNNTTKESVEESAAPKVNVNQYGQRIDDRLPSINADLVKKMAALKLCNRHFLTTCTHPGCTHRHKYRPLSREETLALRRAARSSACPRGSQCYDPNCVAGHNCRFGDDCTYGIECIFPHVTDMTVVESV